MYLNDFLVLCIAYLFVICTINKANGHPKSWLTTSTRPPRKPKRSLTEVDATYYPGLTLQYKDHLRFEELRKFLKEEEEEEAEGEEEVIMRLMQEEKESNAEEPIEFAAQKRVMMQLNKPHSHQHQQETIEIIDLADGRLEFDTVRELRRGNDHRYLDSLKYTTSDSTPKIRVKASNRSTIHAQPKIDDIPTEVVKRLLSDDESVTSGESAYNHQYISSLHDVSPPRSDTALNLRHRQNLDHESQHEYLLHRLLDDQDKIAAGDLNFLKSSNEEVTEVNKPRDDEFESDAIDEAELNWEEYHEYDA